MRFLVLISLFMASFYVYAQQVVGNTKLEGLSISEIREGILSYPNGGTFYVDNSPSLHPVRNCSEYIDSLFLDNPFRCDYNCYAKKMLNRFRREAVCTSRSILVFAMVDSLDKCQAVLNSEDYWKKISESNLPENILGLTAIVRFVDSYLKYYHSDVLDLQQLRFQINLKLKKRLRYEFLTTQKKYFDKLGISKDGIIFKSPKSFVVQ